MYEAPELKSVEQLGRVCTAYRLDSGSVWTLMVAGTAATSHLAVSAGSSRAGDDERDPCWQPDCSTACRWCRDRAAPGNGRLSCQICYTNRRTVLAKVRKIRKIRVCCSFCWPALWGAMHGLGLGRKTMDGGVADA
jgi:hypothetical protein